MKRVAKFSIVVLLAISSIALAATNKLAIPATGAYLGLWGNTALGPSPDRTIEVREGPAPLGIGRTFALHLSYPQWTDLAAMLDSNGIFQPNAALAGDIAHGRVPVLSWKCDQNGTNTNHLIASGDPGEDAIITASAKALAQFPGPVMLRWFWEFNQLNKNQGCRGDHGGTPTAQVYADFIGAWQHIWTLFQEAGATNVVFVWNPGVYTTGSPNDAHGYFPGNAYVDWIAIDAYQRTPADTFISDFDGFYNDFTQPQYAGKPLMASENGAFGYAVNNQEVQVPYLQGFLAAMQANRYPQLKAYDYFDAGGVDTAGNSTDWALDDNNGKGSGGLAAMTVIGASALFAAVPAVALPMPVITSISVCSPTGAGGPGSCPSGSFDTHQIVLAPDGSGRAINTYEASGTSDEHSSIFSPGALGANNDYLFFVGSGTNTNAGIATAVLSGGAGPGKNGQWTFDIPRVDGYGAYPSGFGPVFRQPFAESQCPAVADGNPAHQDQTFDLSYAAPGSVVRDPTGPAGSLLMIYEGTNTCVGDNGGSRPGTGSYEVTAVATSLDYGKTWPTYRATPTFSFVQMPFNNKTQGPNAPAGALGKNVCIGNDCTTTPPAAYGRYPVLTPPTSLASLMAAGQPLASNIGDSQVSAFVDDLNRSSPPYLYVVHNYLPGGGANDLAIARAPLTGGAAPLSFSKWDGQSFNSSGIGGAEALLLPNGPYQNCGAPVQARTGGSIEYVETTQQYLLLFTCRSGSDPSNGPGSGQVGAAWFYSTNSDVSNPAGWSAAQEIIGSWSPIDGSSGCESYKGWYPTMMSLGSKVGHLATTGYVFYLFGCETGAGTGTAPQRQYSARMFTITTSQTCTYSFSSGGQSLPATGGSVVVNVTAPANCPWSVGQLPSWITISSASSGTGPGTVALNVAPNSGADQSASITIGGTPFFVEQQAPSIPGLSFIGSMPHLAAEGGWLTTFTFVNKSPTTATTRTNLFSPAGAALPLPIALPQQSAVSGNVLASSFDQAIAPNAQFVMQATGPANVPYFEGSAQLNATGIVGESVDGFAIFHYNPNNQEAVVPMETRNAASYVLPFDNTNGVLTGVALENVSANGATIPVVIRDDTGRVLLNIPVTLNGSGHASFVLSAQFTQTANIRGTVEFDTPSGGQISVLGIRYTGGTLTTIPVLTNVTNTGGLMAHLASGNGWQTTFVLLNTGTNSASATLKFFGDSGAALALPLTFPQDGSAQTVSSITQSIAAGASSWMQSAGPLTSALLTGSAQLTTTGNISGFVIFRYTPNGQEAVVPLESRNASSYVLAFDNTAGTVTGVALSASGAQNTNIPVVIRDDTGAQIGTSSILLNANGHTSFTLTDSARGFPATANIRGTVEFETPAGAQISVLGIRSPPALTFTTLPALSK